ncbi:hypothetical protein [Flavobacterium stagni]|uniref:DUF5780 domain-containing protein n=1 Tax=Flavobacterium stagni TaxID=2506421 RepID=A0A4V1N2V0_9FLAO|nr:hypothetical protein [Flavobacterium stagni]RXR23494.1 hypothetical protein EQG61_05875 [Flavobacterium stagni]
MKLRVLFTGLFLTILIAGCNQKEKSVDNINNYSDSLERQIKAEKMTDSLIKSNVKSKYTKTDSTIKFPVIIVSSKLVKKEYSNRRDIKLVYKNVSGKRVEAIRFEWYGENAFGEPAEMGDSFLVGSGRGETDEALNPGKIGSGTWEINSSNAKKIINARAREVVFSDGSKWLLDEHTK